MNRYWQTDEQLSLLLNICCPCSFQGMVLCVCIVRKSSGVKYHGYLWGNNLNMVNYFARQACTYMLCKWPCICLLAGRALHDKEHRPSQESFCFLDSACRSSYPSIGLTIACCVFHHECLDLNPLITFINKQKMMVRKHRLQLDHTSPVWPSLLSSHAPSLLRAPFMSSKLSGLRWCNHYNDFPLFYRLLNSCSNMHIREHMRSKDQNPIGLKFKITNKESLNSAVFCRRPDSALAKNPNSSVAMQWSYCIYRSI